MNNIIKSLFLYVLMKFTNLINLLFPNSAEIKTPYNRSQAADNPNEIVLQKGIQPISPIIKPNPCPKETKDYVDSEVARLGGSIEWVDVKTGGSYYITSFSDEQVAHQFDEIMRNLFENGISEDNLKEFRSTQRKSKSLKLDQDIQDMIDNISI